MDYEKYDYLYNERAGILEHEAGFKREDAEKKAWIETKFKFIEDNGLNMVKQEDYNKVIRLQRALNINRNY
jgi:hypothetical protein